MNDRADRTNSIEISEKTSLQVAQAAVPVPPADGAVIAAPIPTTPAPVANPAATFHVESAKSIDLTAVKLMINAEPGKSVTLPSGTQIAAILVNGDDIVIRETNGELIVIKGGLKNVPSLVVDGVEIPSVALVASLQAGGITLPAAGDAAGNAGAGANGQQSSGGNFARGPGDIGDPFQIRDLLGFSEFSRGQSKIPEFESFKIKQNFKPLLVSAAMEKSMKMAFATPMLTIPTTRCLKPIQPNSRRVRELLSLISAVPPMCRQISCNPLLSALQV